jgi:hypothetical protein
VRTFTEGLESFSVPTQEIINVKGDVGIVPFISIAAYAVTYLAQQRHPCHSTRCSVRPCTYKTVLWRLNVRTCVQHLSGLWRQPLQQARLQRAACSWHTRTQATKQTLLPCAQTLRIFYPVNSRPSLSFWPSPMARIRGHRWLRTLCKPTEALMAATRVRELSVSMVQWSK